MKIWLPQQSTHSTTMAALDRTEHGSWWKKVTCLPSLGNWITTLWWANQWKKQKKIIRIQIDNGVIRRGLQNKAKKWSKTYFSCQNRMLQHRNQPHMLPLSSIGHCAKEWRKKRVFQWVLAFLMEKNDRNKKSKTNNQTHFLPLKQSGHSQKQARNLLQL